MSGSFYVYGLAATASEQFDASKLIYIGKGLGYRWQEHFKELESQVRESPKLAALRAAVGPRPTNEQVEAHVWIFAGGLDEETAYALESILIKLYPATTNSVVGRHSGDFVRKAADVRRFFSAEAQEVDTIAAPALKETLESDSTRRRLVLALKGSNSDLGNVLEWTATTATGRIPQSLRYVDARSSGDVRRGWDRDHPWTDQEARERAGRYWKIAPRQVQVVQQTVRERGAILILMVEDPQQRSTEAVARYVWTVTDSVWADYEATGGSRSPRFGIPLGEPEENHPLVGKILKHRQLRSVQGSSTRVRQLRGIGKEGSPAYFLEPEKEN